MQIKNNLYDLITRKTSQSKFAKMVGLDKSNLNKIVNGHLPKYTTMLQIAKALNKQVEEVWYESTDKKPAQKEEK